MPTTTDENPRIDVDRRDGGTTAVEDDDVRFALRRKGCALEDVGSGNGTGQPAAGATAADRDDPGEGSGLEIVRGRVMARTRQVEQRCEGRLHGCDLQAPPVAPSHRYDDHVAIPCEQARDVPRDGCLPDPFASSDHRQRERKARTAAERTEVGPLWRSPAARTRLASGSRSRGPGPLVGHVHDDLGVRKSVFERLQQRHAVLDVAS